MPHISTHETRPGLVAALSEIVGPGNVVEGEAVAGRDHGYSAANLGAHLLVRPGSTDEMSQVVRRLHADRVPMVPHGGLTGLVHGAVSRPGEVIVSVGRLKRIEATDQVERTMTLEAGVTLGEAQAAASEHRLMVPIDIAARDTCTIGGNIATNAGGQRVMRFGMAREMVLGLEVVLADGTVMSMMSGLMKNNAGYDLKQLFIGSEGSLGIITRAVLRLHEAPYRTTTGLIAADDFKRLPLLLRRLSGSLGSKLVSFEVMWPDYYLKTTGMPGMARPLAQGHAVYAIVEAWGAEKDDVEAALEAGLGAALAEGLVSDAVIAKSEAERQRIWRSREDSDAVEFAFPACWSFDVSLPISSFDGYVSSLKETFRREFPGLSTYFFGHLADGNLHIMVGADAENPDVRKAVEEAVYRPLIALRGSISAEHGIGLEKRPYLHYCRTAEEIVVMRRLKALFDPDGLLNPGKIFTTAS